MQIYNYLQIATFLFKLSINLLNYIIGSYKYILSQTNKF